MRKTTGRGGAFAKRANIRRLLERHKNDFSSFADISEALGRCGVALTSSRPESIARPAEAALGAEETAKAWQAAQIPGRHLEANSIDFLERIQVQIDQAILSLRAQEPSTAPTALPQ